MTNPNGITPESEPSSSSGGARSTTESRDTTAAADRRSRTGLIVTIVILVAIIVAGAAVALMAALGFFEMEEQPQAEPTPSEQVSDEPAPPAPVLDFATPQTWCTAVRHTPSADFPDSPSYIWFATLISTSDNATAEQGLPLTVRVSSADAPEVLTETKLFGVVEVVVPISFYGLFTVTDIEANDGRVVPGPFVEVTVTEEESGPECFGPPEPALDDLIIETDKLG